MLELEQEDGRGGVEQPLGGQGPDTGEGRWKGRYRGHRHCRRVKQQGGLGRWVQACWGVHQGGREAARDVGSRGQGVGGARGQAT